MDNLQERVENENDKLLAAISMPPQYSKSEQDFLQEFNKFAEKGKLDVVIQGSEKYRVENTNASKKNSDPCFSLVLNSDQKPDNSKIFQYIISNTMFEVIVLRKDVREKRLEVSLRKFICLAIHKHDVTSDKLLQLKTVLKSENKAFNHLSKIHRYRVFGTIDYHDIKEDFSVFSYYINFESIKEKDILSAIVLDKKGELVRLSLRNELIVDCEFLKIHELYEKHALTNKREKQFYTRLGFTTFPQISNYYEKKSIPTSSEIFDIDFQIKSDVAFNNAGNYESMLQKLKINELSTLNCQSNKMIYQKLKFNYENIRKTQNHMWSFQSLNEGLAYSKEFLYNEAIACYDRALTADRLMVDAYVAKGCALANLHMFQDALKELEKALEIDGTNQNSLKFFNLILKRKTEYEQQEKNTLKNEVLEGRMNIGPAKKQEVLDFIFENK